MSLFPRFVLAGSIAVFAVATTLGGCAEELDTTQQAATSARYVVTYKNPNGRAAVAAAGQVALELPGHRAVAVHLPGAAVTALLANPNIEAVEIDELRHPMAEVVPYGVPMVQADQVPAVPAGALVKLCIIDSGLSALHEDFAGLSVTGSNDSGSGAWDEDLCGHGTHVAGTVAATAGNGLGVVGVAPDAVSLHIVKVFANESCGWAYSSSLVAALDDCEAHGARVVSMSLGGDRANRFEDQAFAAAYGRGVLSIAAAGNDGNTRKSYPASYESVVSVAAIDAAKAVADFSQKNAAVELAAPGVAVRSTYVYSSTLTVGGTTYEGNAIEFAAFGTAGGSLVDGGLCDAVGSWSGNVVLCARGVISFYDKVANAQNGGAAAVVIYNNEPGGFSGTLGAGNSSTIPAISLSQEDGLSLVTTSLGATGTVDSGYGDGYAELDGTSMATPHVSAVAALVWAQVPAATNADIRAALVATAEDLGAAGRDDAYGYGLVQAKATLDYLTAAPPPPGPDCNADGVCNADCAAGADSDCTGSACFPKGTSCSTSTECCSGSCGGKPSARTCK